MEGLEFEHALIDALEDFINRAGLQHRPVAKAAWPEAKNAEREWQRMRTKRGVRQRLTVGDAYSLCRHLGISLSSICGSVELNGPSTLIAKNDGATSPALKADDQPAS